MGANVYANGNEVSCQAGGGKVIAAFPDVCMSPPPPPAGPVPVPYPDSSFSKDMKDGSKSVMIAGKTVMLRDKSYYKSSPLGNEAATRNFGASVGTHTITGKTHFVAWSMDVQFEGKNVVRHIDLTTSNHQGTQGATPPSSNISTSGGVQAQTVTKPICECCKKDMHAGQFSPDGKTPAPVVSEDEWYGLNERPALDRALNELIATEPHPLNKRAVSEWKEKFKKLAEREARFNQRKHAVEEARKHNCPSLPSPPCNVYRSTPPGSAQLIDDAWVQYSPTYRLKHGIPPREKINHRVPKAAGGCPGNATGEGNLVPDSLLSPECLKADAMLTIAQSDVATRMGGTYPANPFI